MELKQDIIDKIFEKYGENLEAERLCTFYRLLVKNGFYKLKIDFPNYENFRFLLDSLIELGLKIEINDEYKEPILTRTFNFDWLRYFLAFTEYNNTAKAAQKLSVTPQAIVKGISNIESFYKIKLINRNKHFTELTREGKIFKVKAEKILNTFTELDSLFTEEYSHLQELNIVYQENWEFYFISKIIDFLNKNKSLKINLLKIVEQEELFNSNIVADIILSSQAISSISSNYECFSFNKSRSAIIGNKELMRKKGSFKFISDINKSISETKLSRSKSYMEAIEKLYVPEKYLKETIYSNNFDTHIKLCENGFGYAFLPIITIVEQLKNKTLEIIEEVPDSYHIFNYLIIKKDLDVNIKKNILKIFDDFNNEI